MATFPVKQKPEPKPAQDEAKILEMARAIQSITPHLPLDYCIEIAKKRL